MQRISVNLTNYCDGKQLNYNNDLPVIGNKNYAHALPVAQGIRFCTQHIFSCEIIHINYFIVKFIKMYSLIFN